MPELILNPVTTNDIGQYAVTVRVDGCSANSDTLDLVIYEQPTTTIANVAPQTCVTGREELELIALPANGVAPYTYLWSGNGFMATDSIAILTNITSAMSGTYTLQITDANGCTSDIASTEVDITDGLTQPILTTTGTVCEGEQITLSVQNYIGNDVLYQWEKDGNPITNINNELIINPVTTADIGEYSVMVTVDGCSANSDTIQVNVFEQPLADITTVAPLQCVDGMQDLELTATPSAGQQPYRYAWTGPNGFTSTDSIATVRNINNAFSGTYQLVVTDANGCISDAVSTSVDITNGLLQPVIEASNPVCHGGEFSLKIAPITGINVTYEWTTPNSVSIGISSLNTNEIFINPVDSNLHVGNYAVRVTVDGCVIDSKIFSFKLLPIPTVNPTVNYTNVCEGGTLQLAANATNAVSYEWSGPNNFTSNLPSPSINEISLVNNGQYGVTVTNTSGCTAVDFITVDSIRTTTEIPTITSNAPICEGEDLVLSTSAAGVKFEWISPLGASVTTLQNHPELTTTTETTTIPFGSNPYVSGMWSVRVTDATGCIIESDPIEVVINEIPVAKAFNNGPICPDGSVQLQATGNSQFATRFEWRRVGETTIISTQQNPIFNNILDTTQYELTVITEGCISPKDTTTVIVWEAPTAAPTTVYTLNSDCAPNDLQLLANVTVGSAIIASYEWTGPNNFTSSLENPVIANATAANNGTYTLIIVDENGCTHAAAVEITNISDAVNVPFITGTNFHCEGENVLLEIPMYAGSSVNYEWQKNGVALTNSNNNQFIIDPISIADTGNYTVQVTVDGCVLNSTDFHLDIYETPTFTLDNDLTIACTDGISTIQFQAENITGVAPIQYAWTGPNGFASTEDTIILSDISEGLQGVYTLIITDANGCVSEASSLTLNISDGLIEPVLTQSGITCEGGDILLEIPVYNGSSVRYNWFKNGVSVANNNNQLILNPTTTADNGRYSVTVLVDGCTTNSDTLDLTVYEQPSVSIVDIAPQACVTGSEEIALIALPSGGVAPYMYAWSGNGFTATDSIAVLTNINSGFSGVYTLQITDANGCVSDVASTNIDITDGLPEAILTQSGVACEGGEIILTVPVYNGSSVRYNWFKDGILVTNNNNQLILNPTTTADNGRYSVTVLVDGCTTNSDTLDLTVYEQPSVSIVDVAPQTCVTGSEEIALIALPSGGVAPYTYLWNGNGFTATDSIAVLTNINSTFSGVYTVEITDANGCISEVASTNIDITDGLVEPIISTSGPICEGGEIALNVPVYNGINVSYNWTTPAGTTNNIIGLNSNSIVINPVNRLIHTGDYFVTVLVDGCTVDSDIFQLDILSAPTVNPTVNFTNICEGGNLQLVANATDAVTYEWAGPNGFTSTLPNPVINNISRLDNGQYGITVTNNSGCTATNFITVDSITTSIELPTITTNSPICEGEDLVLNTSTTGTKFEWISPLGESIVTLQNNPELTTTTNTTTIAAGNIPYLAGLWSVQVTDSTGCIAESDPIEVIINQIPVAEAFNNGPICPNGSVQLLATRNPQLATRYEWRAIGDTTIIATVQNPVFDKLNDTTSYELTIIAANCFSVKDTTTVIVWEAPTTAPTTTYTLQADCSPEDLQLMANVALGSGVIVTYNWTGPNGFTSTLENPIISNATAANNGTYNLVIIDENGCAANGATEINNITNSANIPFVLATGPTCANERVVLQTSAYSGVDVIYLWRKDGNPILNNNNPQLIFNPVLPSDAGTYTVQVAVGNCILNSSTYELTIYDRPNFTLDNDIEVSCTNGLEDIQFQPENITGALPLQYNWTGPNGFRSNEDTIQLRNIAAENAGVYTLSITDANGCVSPAKSLSINITDGLEEPVLTQSGITCEGGEIALTIPVYNGSSVTYNWFKDGILLTNNSNQYLINPATTTDNGRYSVTVVVDGCSTNSDTLDIEIYEQPRVAIVDVAPQSCVTGSEELAMIALPSGGVAPYTYTWTGNGFTATDSIAMLTNITAAMSGTYTVQITDANGCVSEIASTNVDITDGLTEVILTQSGVACEGDEIVIEVPVYNGSSVTYNWFKDGVLLANNNNQLILNPTTTADNGRYAVTIIVDGCSTNSDTLDIEVYEQPTVTIANVAPQSCVTGSEELAMIALPSGGVAPYTYQWTGNGFTATDSIAMLTNITAAMSGTYTLQITDANGCMSEIASTNIDIDNGIVEPILSQSGVTCEGGEIILSTQAYTGNTVMYNWYKDGVLLNNINNQLILNPATVADDGRYTVSVIVDGCTANSDTLDIEIYDRPTVTLLADINQTCTNGLQAFELYATNITGVAPFLYQWSGPNGYTSNADTVLITNTNLNNAGVYTLIITDANGCQSFAQSVAVNISEGLDEPIIQSTGITCEDDAVTLNVQEYNGVSVDYDWYKDGVLLNSINNTLIITPVKLSDIGKYTVTVSVDGCVANSDTFDLGLYAKPYAEIAFDAPQVCSSTSDDLDLSAIVVAGERPYRYDWRGPNNFFSSDSIATIVNITNENSGIYTLVVTDANGCISDITSTVVDITEGLAEPVIMASDPGCQGESVSLSIIPYVGQNVQYIWHTPNGVTTSISGFNTNAIFINPLDSNIHQGAYTVEVVLDDCTIESDTFFLNTILPPTVNPTASANTICEGGSIRLRANATNANSFEWSGPNDFSSNLPNPLITNITTQFNGEYIITVTNSSGCTAVGVVLVDSILINEQVPSFVTNSPICEGEDLVFTSSSFGDKFEWIGPLGSSITTLDLAGLTTTNGQTVIPPGHPAYVAGAWRLRLTDLAGCKAESEEIEIVINSIPTAEAFNEGPVCVGGDVQLTATRNSQPATRYEWRVAGDTTIISTEQNPLVLNIEESTRFELTVSALGCVAEKATTSVVVWEAPQVAPNALYTLNDDCAPTDLQLFANVTSGADTIFNYLWTGPNDFSSTIANPTVPNATAEYNGTYTLVVTDGNGCQAIGSTEITTILNPNAVPFITASGPVCESERVVLEVNEYAGSNVLYTWIKDGLIIQNNNSPRFVIDPVQPSHSGDYYVSVNVDGCTIISSIYQLNIYEKPQITIDSVPAILCAIGTEELQLNANITGGFAPYTFEWVGPNNFFSVSEDPILVNVNSSMDGSYTVFVTDANGCQSDAFTIEVDITESINQPILTTNGPICSDERLVLSTQLYQGNQVRYEWIKDSVIVGTGSTNEWTIFPVDTSDSGQYQVRIIVNECENISDSLEIIIYDKLSANPAHNGGLCGDDLQLFTNLVNRDSNAQYLFEWTGPNGFISNAENPIIANPAALNEGSYVVEITNENGCTSNFATTEVTLISTTLDQPFITYNGAICEGEQLVLSTLQLSGRAVNYEWLGPDSTSTTKGDYPNSPFLIIDQVTAANSGGYQVIISVDSCQTLTSAVVAVTIDTIPEFSISNSGIECVLANADIQLFATPTDTNTRYTYEWSGPNNFFSTAQNPVLPNAQNALAGTYTVTVSNGGGCQASQSTVLDISNLPNRPIISSNGALCEGENLILTAPFYEGTDVRYEWIGPNGSTLDSTYLDNPTLSLERATIAANGDYQVRVIIDGCASLFSAPFAVNVNAGLTAIITSNSLACVETNNTLTLTSEVNGGQAPYTYEWIGPNGFNSVASAPVLANLVGNQSGTYTLKVVDANGCTSNVTEQFISIMTQPAPPELLLGANDFCEGEELILSTNNYQGDTVTFHWQINGDSIENYSTVEPTLFINNTNANQSGLVNVAVAVDGCLSQISPIKLLTINAVPDKPQLDSLIVACEGTEIQLTTSTVAMDYNWAGPNGFTANVQQPMIIGNALLQNSGIYTLSVLENGCESETASTEVITEARPNRPSLVTAAQICEGEAIELNVPNPIAGNTYQWIAPSVSVDQFPATQNEVGDTVLWTTNNSTIISNIENPNLYESGAWQVRVIDENACASELSLVKNIQINALPEVPLLSNSGPICEGETVELFSGNVADAKYEWFIVNTDIDPANFSLFSTSQDPTFSGLPAGKQQFFLTVTVNGCQAEIGQFTEVEVREIPQVSLPLNQGGLCEGDTLKLDAPTIDNALYNWEGPNGFISYLEDPILVNTSEDNKGSYQLTVSKDGCTANTVSTQVQINRQPATPNVSHNSPVCEGTPIQLTASNVSGGGNLIYEWTGPNGFTANVQNPLIESADSINGGEYMLRVGIDGCFSLPSSPIPLQIKPSPEQPIVTANASIIDPLCEGEILQLATDFDNEATYQWVGPNGFTSNLYNPFINDVTVGQGGKYQLTVIVKDCPSPISDIDVGVQVKPNAPIAGNNSPVCADGELMLNVANADSLVTYEWFRINTNEFVGEGAPLTVQGITNQDVGEYYVIASIGNCASEVFDNQGAIVQAFTEVNIVTPTREIAYAGAEIFSCDPEVNIAAIAPEIAAGSWSVVDPNSTAAIINPTQAATTVANLETGVTELVWSLDNGVCGIVSTDTLLISYNVTPQAVNDTFNIGVNEVIDLGLIRNDELRANDINIYINTPLALGETQRNFEDVQFANNLADSLSRFTYFAAENAVGTEVFEYEICNKECPDLCSTATAVIRIGENVDCEAPNLVTPNNDGFNDSFIVPCLFNNPGSSITIFNRWGDEIYRSDNYQNDWEGTYEDGLLPTGTYYYLLEVNNASGTVLNGYLFLQR